MGDKYFFVCGCGKCKTNSEDLGLNYFRLQKNQKWFAKDCPDLPEGEKKEAVGGYIINLEGVF